MNIVLATPEDSLAIARIHVRSWQSAYRGLLAHEYLDSLHPEERAARYNFTHTDPQQPRTLVAADGGTIYGFVTTMPAADPALAGSAEVAALYVDPNHCGQRLGTQLLETACEHLSSTGYTQAFLWLLAGNIRAEHFYTQHGWQADGTTKTAALWGVTVDEIRYHRNLRRA